MSDRDISPRKPMPPSGLPNTPFPLSAFLKDLGEMRRISLALWSRRSDQEDLRDITKRINRYMGSEVIPGRRAENRDLPCEPIDLVITVAGLLFPGLETWNELRRKGQILADLWWGRWGASPGAAVLRDGVLHMVHLDQDADRMAGCDWAKWAADNWRGPVLFHGVQCSGEGRAEDSPLIARFLRNGAGGGCLLWASTDGLDLRPWRVDIGGGKMLLRPLADGFRIGANPGAPLALRNEMEVMGGFWTWLKSMEVPPEMRTDLPEQIALEAPAPPKQRRGTQGAAKGREASSGLVPLLDDAFTGVDELTSDAEREFGEKIGPNPDPARIKAMLKAAEGELMRATMGHNRRKADHWRAILAELESIAPRAPDISPHPGGTRPIGAP